jgi:beta-lactamase class A
MLDNIFHKFMLHVRSLLRLYSADHKRRIKSVSSTPLVPKVLISTALLGLLWFNSAAAQLFVGDFENPRIAPQFPLVNGQFQLTPGPATTQLSWLLSELAVGQTTSVAEVNAHFDPAWLGQIDATATINFINAVRTSYPNARVTDVISVTPTQITALIDSPGSPPPSGFLTFGTRFVGAQGINQFGVNNFGSAIYVEDAALTLAQAMDKFITLSTAPGMLAARINSNNQCVAIEARSSTALRATASIFKIWVLGGLGRAIAQGNVLGNDLLTLDGTKNVAGSVITVEPIGTQFTVSQLATYMIGNSDNTATDTLHSRVGRSVINQIVTDFNHSMPTILTPVLSISEQFHLINSFTTPETASYLNGTESFQEQFLTNQIVPLGRFISGPNFQANLLTEGTWRASPMDICNAMAELRRFPNGSDAMREIDKAMSAQAALPFVRAEWDRVWYKGGSLASATNNYHVWTHAWLLENAGTEPIVFVSMSNSVAGGIDQNRIFQIQSVNARILQLLALLP